MIIRSSSMAGLEEESDDEAGSAVASSQAGGGRAVDPDGGARRRRPMVQMLLADLRRTRATSIVMAGLIAMAALLAAVGGSVVVQLTGSAGRLFTAARTPDIVQMHAGDLDAGAVGAWADERPEITEWQISATLPVAPDQLHLGDEPESGSVLQPALVTQNPSFDLLLDTDNRLLEVGPGEIAMPLYYLQERDLEVGDPVSVRLGDERFDFTVTAFLRDSIMNPTFATSKRLLISTEDHRAIADAIPEPEYLVEFMLADRGDTKIVSDAFSDAELATNGPLLDRRTFFLLNVVSHGLGVAVLTLLAVLMVTVAAIALRFAFLTAVERDLHEIGVMKAIGLPEVRIRRLYLAKYAALALAGGLVGAILSVPATQLITGPLRLQLGQPELSWVLVAAPIVSAAVVVLAVIAWCALMMRRLGRISTMDALRTRTAPVASRPWWLPSFLRSRSRPTRSASPGTDAARGPRRGRFTSALRMRLWRSRLPASLWMGLNAIRRSLRTHRMLLAVLTLCTFAMLVPLNLWTTVNARSFVTYLGTGVADLRLELRTPEAVEQSRVLVSDLEADPEIAEVASFVTARFEVENSDGEWENLIVETGDHGVFPLSYLEGTFPSTPDELTVSSLAADTLRAGVGDTVALRGAAGVRQVTLVGIYQDMTNGGRTAKGLMPVDGEPIVWRTVLVDTADGADGAAVAERLSATYPDVQTVEMADFADQTLAELTGQTARLAIIAAVSTIALAALIATMFAQMVIARDQSQIAIQRSLGVADRSLRVQYLTRFLVVLVAGIAAGTALVATAGQWLVAGAMGVLGAPGLRFDANPLLAYVAVPLALTVTVVAAALMATTAIDRFDLQHLTEE